MAATKSCAFCQTGIAADATFCGACGQRQPTEQAIPKTIFRPPEQAPAPQLAPQPIAQPAPHPRAAPPPPAEKRGGKGWIVALVLGLVVLGGGGGAAYYFFVLRGDTSPLGKKAPTLQREVLLQQDLPPSAEDRMLGEGELKVQIPLGFSNKTEKLMLARIGNIKAPDGEKVLEKAYEVKLGEKRRFESPIEIAISHPRPAKAPHCLSTDDEGKRWEPVPCRGDAEAGMVIVTTNHLSIFAVDEPKAPEPGPMMRIGYVRYPSGQFLAEGEVSRLLRRPAVAGAMAGWNYAMEWFGLGGAASTIGEHALQIDALKPINKHMPELGLAFAFAQAAIDFAEGKKHKAVLGLVKNIYNYSAGKYIGTRAINIAFVGVFVIDYALDKFTTAAIEGRYKLWERAYKLHYKVHNKGKNSVYWYKLFKRLMKTTRPGDDIGARIRKALHDHVFAFWKNPETVNEYQELAMKRHRFTGQAGLNKRVERKISLNQLRLLRQYLTSALNKIFREVRWHQQDQAYRLLTRAKLGLNKTHQIKVVVKGPEPGPDEKPEEVAAKIRGLKVRIPVRDARQKEKWEGVTDDKGVFELTCTSLGYAVAGLPKKVELLLPPKKPDAEPERLEAKLRLRAHDKVTLVTFDLSQPKLEGVWKVRQTITNMNVNGRWIKAGTGSTSTIELDLGARWKVQKVGDWYNLTSPRIHSGTTTYRIKFTGPKRFVGTTTSVRDMRRQKLYVRSKVTGTRIR